MAGDINRVVLVGRLTRDPELRSTNTGNYFCRFTLASNRVVYNRQTGESREEVGFFDCVAWNRTAELVHKYLQKGRRVCVDGSLRFSSWEHEGKKMSRVEINVDNLQFLDARGFGGATEPAAADAPAGDSTPPPDLDSGTMSDDDIPF
ncbi:MAG: single-stranded DNA-binding protein [Turneriella sp.]|nr:single-stranded DNA-binding protein [Turneriella sp.]